MFERVIAIGAITLVASTSFVPASAQDDGKTLFTRGDFQAAATAYEAVLRARPDDLSARLGLASIRLYQNDLTAAEPLLDSVLSTDARNARATQLLAELMRRRTEAARRAMLAGTETRVPFVASDPLPVVPVIANGVRANFLVDTGADVDLEPEFARTIGVKTQTAGMGTYAGGLHATVARGMLSSLAVGGATAYDVPVHVMQTHASAFFPKLRIDGIVGTTYFERYLVTIDYPKNQLILRPRSRDVSVAFQAEAARSGAAIVPCYLVGDHFVFARAQVNDAPAGLFLFDTGLAGGGLMASAQLIHTARISLNESAAATGIGGGGAVTAVPFVAERIAIGSALGKDIAGTFTPQGDPFGIFPFTVWGAISNDFLRPYAYTVDFEAMKIVLAYS